MTDTGRAKEGERKKDEGSLVDALETMILRDPERKILQLEESKKKKVCRSCLSCLTNAPLCLLLIKRNLKLRNPAQPISQLKQVDAHTLNHTGSVIKSEKYLVKSLISGLFSLSFQPENLQKTWLREFYQVSHTVSKLKYIAMSSQVLSYCGGQTQTLYVHYMITGYHF